MKKIIIGTSIVLGLAVGLPVWASHATTTPATDQGKIACVAHEVAIREAKIATSFANYQRTITAAYATRSAALASAYTAATPEYVKTHVKNVWSAFKTSSKTASKTWRTERRAAWTAYKTAVKVCKAPSGVSDSGNSGYEPSL